MRHRPEGPECVLCKEFVIRTSEQFRAVAHKLNTDMCNRICYYEEDF